MTPVSTFLLKKTSLLLRLLARLSRRTEANLFQANSLYGHSSTFIIKLYALYLEEDEEKLLTLACFLDTKIQKSKNIFTLIKPLVIHNMPHFYFDEKNESKK